MKNSEKCEYLKTFISEYGYTKTINFLINNDRSIYACYVVALYNRAYITQKNTTFNQWSK